MSEPFKYERVQRVRHIEEELAREEYLSYERVASQAEASAAAMQAEIERAQQELGETRMFRRVPAQELLTAQSTLESLDATLAEQRRRARELRAQAEELRTAWEATRADAKTLDRLEERHAADVREAQRLAEARVLDELALRGPGDHLAAEPAPDPDSGLREGPEPPAPHRSSPDGPPADEEGPRTRT